MSGGVVHVVGAGLAGLSAAVSLVEAGRRVVVHEAAKAAGGRCRSYRDASLGLEIDNGNHLLLTGNRAALGFVERVGGMSALTIAPEAAFPFADLATGERWTLRPNRGRLPWWIFAPSRRVPGTAARDYLRPAAILVAKGGTPIGRVMATSGRLWERLWHPVLLAALNTEPERSACGLAAPVLRETLGAGGDACRPVVATGGLSAAFVDPALRFLRSHGAEIRFGVRLRGVARSSSRVTGLSFLSEEIEVGDDDGVVLALPPWVAADLLPGIAAPDEYRGIVNAHFRTTPGVNQPLVLGVIGGLSEWIFAYPDRISVTISAGDRLFGTARDQLAQQIWQEVSAVTGRAGQEMPPWQVVKEKRATFAATPEQARKRAASRTDHANLALAGDWTATGLPSTIEGAIRSGEMAASVLQGGDGSTHQTVPRIAA